MENEEERRAMAEITARLARRYPHVPDARVKSVVDASYHELDSAPVRNFVGILVEKEASGQLADTAG
jgi:hypothetical protein